LVVRKGPEWWVKIADFGISKRATEGLTALRTFAGTLEFMAPELLGYGPSDEPAGETYTDAVGIWSTGVVTLLILTGNNCFQEQKQLGQYASGRIGLPLHLLRESSINEWGTDFTRTLMAVRPKDRSTAEQSLWHSWITCPDSTVTHLSQRYRLGFSLDISDTD
jgi:calcium/calmodulin-dependent protein kinase I